ncbi:MAG: SRPBCC family protein [Solirubrobacterales bacterium]|nr:SRPBCC family protein [Solirubrobacterales bacterium]
MARNSAFISAPPEAVFDVLANPRSYGEWVVGSRKIRAADEHWPAPGARFDHTVGLPLLQINDQTLVLDASPPNRLELKAKARPLPSAHITIELQPEGNGTRLTMVENISNSWLNLLAGPVTHIGIRLRNHEALRRLRLLAERGDPTRRSSIKIREGSRSDAPRANA